MGLVTAACFARKGHEVIGIDTDNHRLEQIQRGETPFFEPDLVSYLEETLRDGRLRVTPDPSANSQSDLAYITVGTPSNREGSIDLAHVKNAARAIAQSLRHKDLSQLVVVKSTVIPGTARNLVRPMLESESGKIVGEQIHLCSNPEFLREGNAIRDTEFPDRIILGSDDAQAIAKLETFYNEFYGRRFHSLIRTTHENAELIKYANNAFLATKISFINCIANIAELIPHTDISVVAKAIGMDERIGRSFLNAGLGWGGSCLPKDVEALIALSKTMGYSPDLIEATLRTNQNQWRKAIKLAKQALGSLSGKRVAVLGLAFKPNTDDMREAVSIPIVKGLLTEGASVVAYDPAAMKSAELIFKNLISYAKNLSECVEGAECAIIVTEWDEFKGTPLKMLIERMKQPTIIDCRRLYDLDEVSQVPIRFLAIGVGPNSRKACESSPPQ